MLAAIKRHWKTAAVLLVLGVLLADAQCNDIPRLRAEIEAAKEAAAADSAALDAALERSTQDSLALVAALERARQDSAAADSLRRVAQAAQQQAQDLDQQTPAVVASWDSLPDTANVATVRAVGDSTIRHLTDVGEHWRQATIERTRELQATQEQLASVQQALRAAQQQIGNVRAALTASQSRSANLQRAVEALEEQLQAHEAPWLQTATLAVGGAGIGYAVAGRKGALVGGSSGVAISLLWYGLRSYVAP